MYKDNTIDIIADEAVKVLKNDYDTEDAKKTPCRHDSFHSVLGDVTVSINIKGGIEGVVVLSIDESLLRHIVYFFTWDKDMYDDEIGLDSLLEFVNIIAGHVLGYVSNTLGIDDVNISTPYVFRDEIFDMYDHSTTVDINTQFGTINLFYLY